MARASAQKPALPKEGADRRRTPRAPAVIRVQYATVDAFFSEFTRDINEGGLFIETESPLAPESELTLQFQLPGGSEPVRVRGRVVWTRSEPGPGDPPGMGVEFEELDAEARTRIDHLVRNLRNV